MALSRIPAGSPETQMEANKELGILMHLGPPIMFNPGEQDAESSSQIKNKFFLAIPGR